MAKRYVQVGIFLVMGVTLFAVGLFLIGNRHEAFSHHVVLYGEFSDVDGLTKGSKVRVAGMDAGQVVQIAVPASPQSPFLVQMRIDEKLHGLVRSDSIVTIDTEGVVGETFLTIHSGNPGSPIAPPNSILQSKPPISISDLLANGMGVMNDADAGIKQLGSRLNVTLDGVTRTVGSVNDILTGLQQGKGPAGALLRDEKMAAQIRDALTNVQTATSTLSQASTRVNSLLDDIDQRHLPQKLDDTMAQVQSASTQANATIQEVHESLHQALGPDPNGVTAGENISEALTNVNDATGNMADDTEALKHSLFFKGFFIHRGYYGFSSMSPEEYRDNKLFSGTATRRTWLAGDALFQPTLTGSEELTKAGKLSIDEAISHFGDAIFRQPVVIEGYADGVDTAVQLSRSYNRAVLVRTYLETRFPFAVKNLGVMPLNSTPPPAVGRNLWSGVCIVIPRKK